MEDIKDLKNLLILNSNTPNSNTKNFISELEYFLDMNVYNNMWNRLKYNIIEKYISKNE